jgi:hypothetical protein
MRIFPLFEENDIIVHDPERFISPPALTRFYPNYLQFDFTPLPNINVIAEYWTPESNRVAGRIRLQNTGADERDFRMELVALLNPSGGEGMAMLPVKKEAVNVLQGRTENLEPILFLTGGPYGVRSPYTSLAHDLNLPPGTSRRFTWVLASGKDADENFREARVTAARVWEAEVARIEMANAGGLEIQTGDGEWDAAFALGQAAAQRLMHNRTPNLPHKSFVNTRLPEQGYSPSGDGSDHSHLWEGQTTLDAVTLIDQLLPGNLDTAKGLLLNFIATQSENGHIEFKPGLGGQRTQLLATPVLAEMAWRIYQHSGDELFLREVFPYLQRFIERWFHKDNDRDEDGVPEWSSPLQTGFDDNPTFVRWAKWGQGADITTFESPDLCAYLYNECSLLIKIAEIIKQPGAVPPLQAWRDNLYHMVDSAFNARTGSYSYWDRVSHQSPKGEKLGKRKGSGDIPLDVVFELPRRMLVKFEARNQSPIGAHAFVHGHLDNGQHRVERFGREQLNWLQNIGIATSQSLYADLEHAQIEGLPDDASATLNLVDFRAEDHSLLLPYWAQMADEDQAGKLFQKKLNKSKQYLRAYGLPACPKPPKDEDAATTKAVWLPWNVRIGRGLLRHGHRSAAADLVGRIMAAMIQTLRRERAFRKHYLADSGAGLGERNALAGLPPLGLFLDTLGVRILSPNKVYLYGFNPFPWPVRLKYRGLLVECEAESTQVSFPDSQSVKIEVPGHWLVESKASSETQS